MKRALSLFLAVLMIVGCMSFVVSAEETTYDAAAVFEKYGIGMTLSEPIEVAPVQNGTIVEGEYNYKVVTDTSSGAVAQYGKATTTGDYTGGVACHNNSLLAGTFTEYFAFDADYLYYAVDMTGHAMGTIPEFYLEFDSIDGPLTAAQTAMLLKRGHTDANNDLAYSSSFGYNTSNTGGRIINVTAHVAALIGATANTSVNGGTSGVNGGAVLKTARSGRVAEFRIARAYVRLPGATSNSTAYAFYNYEKNGTGTRYIWGAYCENADAAAKELGLTAATYTNVLPRVLFIEEEKVEEPEGPDYTGMNLPEILAANGTEHIVLDKPIATAPVQDGTANLAEYGFTRSFTVAGNDSGDYFYNGTIGASTTFQEYVAYDADYIYYAIVSSRFMLNTSNNRVDFEFGVYDSDTENASWLSSSGGQNYVVGENFRTTLDNSVTFTPRTAGVAAAVAEKFGGGLSVSTGAAYTDVRRDAICEMKVNSNGTALEIKIARKYLANDNGVYAYLVRTRNRTVNIGDVLSAEDKNALGSSYNYAPRFIIINDPDVATSRAASARLSEDKNLAGLRFKTNVNVKGLEAAGYTINEIGTLIAPTDTIGAGKALAELSLEAGSGAVVGENILKVVADKDTPFATGDKYNTYAGSIVGIKEGNLDRAFSAVGYVNVTKDGETFYIYSDVVASRDVKTIANAAGSDTLTLDEGKESTIYKHYDEEVEAWRPYSSAELKILGYLVTGTYED